MVGPFEVPELTSVSGAQSFCGSAGAMLLSLSAIAINWFTRSAEKEPDLRDEVEHLRLQISQMQRERRLLRWETDLLIEVLEREQFDAMVQRLLRGLTAHYPPGWACYYHLQGGEATLVSSMGLSLEPTPVIQLPEKLRRESLANPLATYPVDTIAQCLELPPGLLGGDPHPVFACHLSSAGGTFGLVFSNVPALNGLEPEQAQSILGNLLRRVAQRMRRCLTQEQQSNDFELAREILSLRHITDLQFDTPLAMLEGFVQRLASATQSDRAALYLSTADSSVGKQALIRCGTVLPIGVADQYAAFEDTLAAYGLVNQAANAVDGQSLRELGIEHLLGQALLIPLFRNSAVMGVVCLTRRSSRPYDPLHVSISEWAGSYLSETIIRALNLALTEREARLDPLTRLDNRRSFDLAIVGELENARESGQELSICLIDVDRFKLVNDRYGHPTGDAVLREVSHLVRQETNHVRSTDRPVVARYGGEELAVLLPGVGLLGARRIADSLRQAVERHTVVSAEHEVQVTVSIGISSFPRHGETVEALVAWADRALYHAKNSGRNRVCTATDCPG